MLSISQVRDSSAWISSHIPHQKIFLTVQFNNIYRLLQLLFWNKFAQFNQYIFVVTFIRQGFAFQSRLFGQLMTSWSCPLPAANQGHWNKLGFVSEPILQWVAKVKSLKVVWDWNNSTIWQISRLKIWEHQEYIVLIFGGFRLLWMTRSIVRETHDIFPQYKGILISQVTTTFMKLRCWFKEIFWHHSIFGKSWHVRTSSPVKKKKFVWIKTLR